MSGVTFTQNLAVDRGGAIYAVGFSSINILSKSTFLNNRAIGGVGGDLYASSSTTAAFNSSINVDTVSIFNAVEQQNSFHIEGSLFQASQLHVESKCGIGVFKFDIIGSYA